MKIVSIGEILWDVFESGEHLGGAPFNFAVNARRLGHDVRFVSAVGDDERGRRALAEMERLGLATDFVRRVAQPTGAVRVGFDASGEPDYTIYRPAAYDLVQFDPRLIDFQADWIYFGTLLQMDVRAAAAVREILERIPAKCFYDVNLRRGSYTVELVEELLDQADAVKLNENERATLGWNLDDLPASFKCVTRGERGCLVMIGEDRAERDGYRVHVADRVGAGDAFAAAFLHGVGEGWPAAKVADFANRLGALVASRAGAIPEWSLGELSLKEK